MGHQEMQQPIFRWPEGDRTAIGGHPMAGRVQSQAANLHRLIIRRRLSAPQNGINPGHQLPGREGLGHVVIRPHIEPPNPIRLLAPGRQHDNRQIPGCPIPLQAAGKINAALAGQHPVQHHEIRQAKAQRGTGVLGRLRMPNPMPGSLQSQRHHLADGRFIFYQQNARHWHPPFACPIGWY